MSYTLKLILADGTSERRWLEPGAVIPVAPSTRVQVANDGRVIEPSEIGQEVAARDLILTLPNGDAVTLEGFADSQAAGGGLEGLGHDPAIMLDLTHVDGTTATWRVQSGAAVTIDVPTRVRVQANGQVIDPARIARSGVQPEVILTLPGGKIVTLLGLADITLSA